MEVVERHCSYSTSDARGKGFTRIANKIRNSEQSGRVLRIILSIIEVPVVGKLERETRVVACLHCDDVCHEVRTKKETERADTVGTFGFPAGQGKLGEVFVWSQHH